MRRPSLLSVSAFALLLAGLARAEEPRRGAPPEKPGPAPAGERVSPKAYADAFLREHDRDKDGFLQREELPTRCHDHFAKLDANKDNKLGPDEVAEGLMHLYERPRPSDVVFVLVEMSDCDDGCAEELQRAYSLMRKLDRNGDGKLDAEELSAGRTAVVKERVDGLFEGLDADRDGKISKEEARGQVRQHFGQIDADADGSISREEMTKAASARPAGEGPDAKKDRP